MINATLIEAKAKELFGENGLYCAESVLTAVTQAAGIESPLIPRIASGFCGGMARTRGTCGALTGGIMALSVVYGLDNAEQSQDKIYQKVQQFLKAFQDRHGFTNCHELIGFDLGVAAQRQAFSESGGMEKCRRLTGSAARLAADIINND